MTQMGLREKMISGAESGRRVVVNYTHINRFREIIAQYSIRKTSQWFINEEIELKNLTQQSSVLERLKL